MTTVQNDTCGQNFAPRSATQPAVRLIAVAAATFGAHLPAGSAMQKRNAPPRYYRRGAFLPATSRI